VILRHLRYFLAAAEAGSLAQAARSLRVAQPALSRQVHALEASLGTRLFDVEHRGIQLTPDGDAVAARGRALLHDLGNAVRRARAAHDGRLGVIRLGLSRVAVQHPTVSRALAAARAPLPDVDVVIREVGAVDQPRALLAGEIDAGIGVVGGPAAAVLESLWLYDEPVDCAIVPERHPLGGAESVRLQELAVLPLIVMDAASTPVVATVNQALARAGFVHRESYHTAESVYAFVAAGRGWTLAPHSFLRHPPRGTRVVQIRDFTTPLRVGIHWRADNRSQVLANFARVLADACRETGEPAGARERPRGVRTTPWPPQPNDEAIELREVEAVIAAIEEGSLARAAERLGVTQSAVSRQVSALEHRLGFVLVGRHTRTGATDAGRVFYAAASRALAEFQAFLHGLRRPDRIDRPRVLGAVPSELAGDLLSAALLLAATRAPELAVEVREVLTSRHAAAIRSGEIDVAISGAFPDLDDPAIAWEVVASDVVDSALLAEGHALSGRELLRGPDLAHDPFVFLSREAYPQLFDVVMTQFDRIGLVPTIERSVNGPRAIWGAVAEGGGWTVGTHAMQRQPPSGLVAVPIEGFALPAPVYLLWRRGESDAQTALLVQAIRDAAATLRAPAAATVAES
jgi:DNA-binding transcriptional LysR family regulator